MKYPIINNDTFKSVNEISCEMDEVAFKDRGSISIEAAVAMSVMSFIAVFFISMLQLASGKSILKL